MVISTHLGVVQNQDRNKEQARATRNSHKLLQRACIPHSSAIPWNNFNPSFSLSRDSTATNDDTTVTKEGWNSDPNCYSPQLGSYAQETLLVNTSLSNTQLQAALWTKWARRKESKRRKWGSNLKWHAAITPPRPPVMLRAVLPAPLTGGHGRMLGKHQIHLFRMGFGFCGSRLCSLL